LDKEDELCTGSLDWVADDEVAGAGRELVQEVMAFSSNRAVTVLAVSVCSELVVSGNSLGEADSLDRDNFGSTLLENVLVLQQPFETPFLVLDGRGDGT
jgi:hypothetical protein